MKNITRFTLLASASLTLLGAPAYAQNAPAADGASDSDTIIVTARKREENLIDVPLPVSVATAAQLQRDKVYTITDLQRVTPALEVSQTSGGEVNGGARLRGLGTGVFNASVSPSVAFVVDQVPQGNLAFPFLFDMGQVEVLRGPQGTLFGQGASAGVINISTVAPTTSGIKVSGGVDYSDKGTAGSEVGEFVARGAFNVPLGTTAALRVSGQYKKETGLQRNTALGLDNKISDFGVRARLLLEPSDGVTINLSGEHTQTTQHGWNFFAIATAPNSNTLIDPDGPGPAPTLPVKIYSANDYADTTGCKIPVINARAEFYCEDTQASLRNKSNSFSANIAVELSDSLTLTSVTAYRTLDRATDSVNYSRRLGVAARTENTHSVSKQFSQELRLTYESDKVNVVGGAMYSDFSLETLPINSAIGFGGVAVGKRTGFSVCHNLGFFCPVGTSFSYENTKNNIFAVFTDATFSLTDQLDLFGGLRYSSYKNTTGVGVDRITAARSSKISDDNVSGRVGLSYKPSSGSTIYASFARGYKPPAIVVPTIATDPVTNLKPEQSTAFELGGKVELGHLQLSGNVFYTKVNNFQVQNQSFNSSGALISQTLNISNVNSKGFELGIFGRVSDNLTINAGYQYNDVKFPKNFIGNDGISLSGTQFLNAPRHKLTLSGEFSTPVGNALEVFFNSNVVYKSSVLLAQNGNPAYRYPGHAIVNAGFGLRDPDGKWTASIFARNLTKQREPTAYLASDFAGSSDGGIRAWPVAGLTARVVGVSLGFNF
jgi:iron complex outermembrane receptor protein